MGRDSFPEVLRHELVVLSIFTGNLLKSAKFDGNEFNFDIVLGHN